MEGRDNRGGKDNKVYVSFDDEAGDGRGTGMRRPRC